MYEQFIILLVGAGLALAASRARRSRNTVVAAAGDKS